jgi:putative membrane protein
MSEVASARSSNDLAEARTDLARDRTRLAITRTVVALERTLMAWIRTATSLISFGFTVYKFFQTVSDTQPVRQARLLTPRLFALVMMGLGVGGLLFATMEYHVQRRDIERQYPAYGPYRRSATAAVATTVVGLGVCGLVLVFLRQ